MLSTISRQFCFVFCTIFLYAFPVRPQAYSWKQVAPFPYYRVSHSIKGNNAYFAYGRIIDSLDEFTSDKTEVGTTPFFMISSDAKTWKRISPKVVYPADKEGGSTGREEKVIPLKTFFLTNTFVSLGRNTKNEKKIYLSENGTDWHPAGIDASSLNFVHDHLIVEHDLAFSVSTDGKKWDSYGAVFPEEPGRHKNIAREFRTVSIEADNPSTVSFNGDSTRGYFTDSSFVLTDNDRTIGISRDGAHWRVVERPIFKNDSLVENVIGYGYGNRRFVCVTSGEDGDGFIFSSTDGKKWGKTSIDTTELIKEYGEYYFAVAGFSRFFFRDSLFNITRKMHHKNSTGIGFTAIPIQYVSSTGMTWKINRDIQGKYSVLEYAPEKVPGEWMSGKLDSMGMRFRFGPNSVLEPVFIKHYAQLLMNGNRLLLPVERNRTYLQSFDGYTWSSMKWDLDTSLLRLADPYYNETHTFVKFYCEVIHAQTVSSGDDGVVRSGYVKISKDRKKWDTVNVDSLIKESHYSPDLIKYPDGLIITTYDKCGWYSADGRKWRKLNIAKSRTDSCLAFAKFNAAGNDRKIYIFPDGTAKLSNDPGTQWFPVVNKCSTVKAVCFGNGRFVAAGEYGRIWVLEVDSK